jgi:hypothetical protein
MFFKCVRNFVSQELCFQGTLFPRNLVSTKPEKGELCFCSWALGTIVCFSLWEQLDVLPFSQQAKKGCVWAKFDPLSDKCPVWLPWVCIQPHAHQNSADGLEPRQGKSRRCAPCIVRGSWPFFAKHHPKISRNCNTREFVTNAGSSGTNPDLLKWNLYFH